MSRYADGRRPYGVAMIGHGFMGAVHSHAWRAAPAAFPLNSPPRLQVLVGRDIDRARTAAARYGWDEACDSWEQVVTRDDIDIVDICTPVSTHEDIAVAALRAGKHVLCEKPLAMSVNGAETMATEAAAASKVGVRSMVMFNYRRVPAMALARQLISDGRIGTVRQVRASYLQDWLSRADAPMSWRLRRETAGTGALGDIGAHVIDLTQYLIDQSITRVSGLTHTFVPARPAQDGQRGLELVTVDDLALFAARFSGGAIGSFEATRMATGRKNAMHIEVNGSSGSITFDFERLNELLLYDDTDPPGLRGFRRVLVTEPDHPYLDAWWPPGHGLGYEHAFTHQLGDFLRALDDGSSPKPSFSDGLQVQRVISAVQSSSAQEAVWTDVQDIAAPHDGAVSPVEQHVAMP